MIGSANTWHPIFCSSAGSKVAQFRGLAAVLATLCMHNSKDWSFCVIISECLSCTSNFLYDHSKTISSLSPHHYRMFIVLFCKTLLILANININNASAAIDLLWVTHSLLFLCLTGSHSHLFISFRYINKQYKTLCAQVIFLRVYSILYNKI